MYAVEIIFQIFFCNVHMILKHKNTYKKVFNTKFNDIIGLMFMGNQIYLFIKIV